MGLLEEEPEAPIGGGVRRFAISMVIVAALTVVAAGWYWSRQRARAPANRPSPSPPSTVRSHPQEVPDTRPGLERPAPAPPETLAMTPQSSRPVSTTLHIESDVPAASVFLDRQYLGTTPLIERNLDLGSHQLNVSAQGYDGYAETLKLEPGTRDVLVRFKEVRLDVSIAVVHKHRFGSCRGRLSASPKGLRYDATQGDDGFVMPMYDLERIDIDYLKKDLRIKRRGGKSYDFTDPDGNADRLFVFHSSVEKSRERLAKGDPPAG